MTAVITRSPLQSLNMVTTQGVTRRKSAQNVEDEGDARPQKRQKVDDSSKVDAKQANGKRAAQTKSRSGAQTSLLSFSLTGSYAPFGARDGQSSVAQSEKKLTSIAAAYDEDVDGFSFRKRPKAVSKPKEVVQEQAVEQKAQSLEKAPAKEKSKRASQGTSSTDEATAPKRRSARLSAEDALEQASKDEDASAAGAAKKGTARRQSRPKQDAATRITPVPKDGPIQVEKKQRETKIALPFADTPIIDRNREMRDVSNSSRRRSSSGMRGRRASSLMNSGSSSGRLSPAAGNGDDSQRPRANLSAEPHTEVRTEEFYKHISQDLPERERMRQLLTWCGTRALSELPKSRASGHFNAIRAARTIQDELLRDFTARPEMSDWYNRPEEPAEPMTLVKKPNPRNQQNAAKLVELEQQAKRLEAERESWDKLLGNLSTSLETRRIAPDKSTDYSSAVASINPSILDAPGQKDALAVAASFDSGNRVVKERVQKACDSIEFAVDDFAQALHQASSFRRVVDQAADRLLGDTAQALDRRDRDARERSGMDKVGVGDVLRGIGKAS